MRVLLVDDEAPAREKLRNALSKHAGAVIVGEAGDGEQAVTAIRELTPDAVFLDVQMPRLDGFGVIREVGSAEMPVTVFVTAFDQHAVSAFEANALDYLLKPWSPSRLRQVVERLRRRLAERDATERAARLEAAVGQLRPPAFLERVLVAVGDGRERLLPMEEVLLIESSRNEVHFDTGKSTYVRRATLTSVAERLDPERFVRINRSQVVRIDAIVEMRPWFHGDYHIQLRDGRTLTWSRRFDPKSLDQL